MGGVEHLGAPPLPLGVAQVHPQQVRGEQGRLLAALAGHDLDDDVAVVVGVARDEQAAQVVAGGLGGLLQDGQFGRERRVLEGQLARGADVVGGAAQGLVGLHDGGELRVASPERPGSGLVGVHGGVRQLPLEHGVLGQQRLDGGAQRVVGSCL